VLCYEFFSNVFVVGCWIDGDVKDPTAAIEDADSAEFVHHLNKSCCKLTPC
jgi:hypothetical protein